MKPLIKWAGGKTQEIKYIKDMIPDYNRYFEPFMGGGAVFFNLEPKEAYINDFSKDLIDFYLSIKDNNLKNKFQKELEKYLESWNKINIYMEHFGTSILDTFNKYKIGKIDKEKFKLEINELFEKKIVPFNGLFTESFCIDRESLLNFTQNNVISKLNRIKDVIDTENKFNTDEIMKNVETAFRSGFYMHFREIMNRDKKGEIKLKLEKKIANYYYVREFCYGGMFRYNAKGDFNIPYGGNAYNKKNFGEKVNKIFSKSTKRLFENTTITNLDFENFLKSYKLNAKDFIFLDPPYDSDFSEYDENPFTKEDQKRLATLLIKTKAKFILIIKETDFIRSIYENKKNINIISFSKTYLYNMKGRNDRNVNHLIISNFKTKKLIR